MLHELAEAIRIGAIGQKQISGRLTDGGDGKCAIGAVFRTLGWWDGTYPLWDTYSRLVLEGAFPGISDMTCLCPYQIQLQEEVRVPYPVIQLIVHLNDDHHWTFDQIADWVDSLDIKVKAEISEEVLCDA